MADNQALADAVNLLLAQYGVTRDQIADLLGGTVDGGPNGNGDYPITLANGTTFLAPCPRKLALLSGDVTEAIAALAPIVAAAVAARNAATTSAGEAAAAEAAAAEAAAYVTGAVPAFDAHALIVSAAYDNNAAAKLTSYNNNADTVLTAFNGNYTTKLGLFNDAVTAANSTIDGKLAAAADSAAAALAAAPGQADKIGGTIAYTTPKTFGYAPIAGGAAGVGFLYLNNVPVLNGYLANFPINIQVLGNGSLTAFVLSPQAAGAFKVETKFAVTVTTTGLNTVVTGIPANFFTKKGWFIGFRAGTGGPQLAFAAGGPAASGYFIAADPAIGSTFTPTAATNKFSFQATVNTMTDVIDDRLVSLESYSALFIRGAIPAATADAFAAILKQLQFATRTFPNFPALSAAYAAGRGIISFVGDSTTQGVGSGTATVGTSPPLKIVGADAFNVTAYFAAALANYGAILQSRVLSDLGNAKYGLTPTQSGTLYTNAVTFGAGWSFLSNNPNLGGDALAQNNSTTNAISIPTVAAYDRIEIIYSTYPGSGTLTVDLDGAVLTTIDQNQANLTRRMTINCSAAAGAHTINIKRAAGQVYAPMQIRWYSSTRKCIQIENLGISGGSAYGQVLSSGNGWNPLNALGKNGTNLFIVNLGLNDASRTAAQFKSDIKTYLAACLATGADVLPCIPTPAATTDSHYMDAAFRQQIPDAAAELGIGYVLDLYSLFGSYAASSVDYDDPVHLKSSGYSRVAAPELARLTAPNFAVAA